MFGGANLVPSDIEIRRSYFFKPSSWRVGEARVNLAEAIAEDTSGRRVDSLRPEFRIDQLHPRVISRLSPQSNEVPYSLMNPPHRPAFTTAW